MPAQIQSPDPEGYKTHYRSYLRQKHGVRAPVAANYGITDNKCAKSLREEVAKEPETAAYLKQHPHRVY